MRALLGDPSFPLEWRETTMSDGKPLMLSIAERGTSLFVSVVKQDEGLWAEGTSSICVDGDELEVRFSPGKMSLGPAANWAMRFGLEMGADFTLIRVGAATMRIATMGWSGMFSARELSRH